MKSVTRRLRHLLDKTDATIFFSQIKINDSADLVNFSFQIMKYFLFPDVYCFYSILYCIVFLFIIFMAFFVAVKPQISYARLNV